ncbi:hypothetical protein [Sphingomonas sp.]|uniref:hypothetical protein n=1 Tax=Sphingomonas sp. TaxID=28214 RepID=UPI001B021E80|nr:hypothetical protein [Sphingomonas sp.]MBO9713767.1 DUF4231 domain-containing protein [Sphingomonas sp.]
MSRSRSHPPRPALNLSIGITGHRPPVLDTEAAAAAAPRLLELFKALAREAEGVKSRYPELFDPAPFRPRLVSPLAEGADQIAAEAAIETGYALQVILPLPRDDYRTDFPAAAFARFESLIERATGVLELPVQPLGRDEGYALAGRATVAHCDILVALWDGEPSRGLGGTADIVALALRRGIPVIHVPIDAAHPVRVLWTSFGEFIDASMISAVPAREVSAALIAEVVNDVLGPPEDPTEAAHLADYLRERERLLRPRLEYPLLLATMGVKRMRASAFASARYAEATRREWAPFHASVGGGRHGVEAPLDAVEQAFGWADRLAQHFAQIYRSGHVLNFTLGALAVLIALTGLLFPQIKFWGAVLEAFAIGGFVLNTWVGTKRGWHRRWLEYRQLAERIRPMRSLKLLGTAAPPPGHGGVGQPQRWIDWYARAQWRATGCPAGRILDSHALVAAIVAEEIKPQMDYHHSSAHQMHQLDHRLHTIGMVLFFLSIIGCFSSIFIKLLDHHFAELHGVWFVAFAAGLPALGAAIFGIRMQGDFGASAERSEITAHNLARIEAAIEDSAIGLRRQTDLAEAAAATMLSELGDWHQAYAQRRLELP